MYEDLVVLDFIINCLAFTGGFVVFVSLAGVVWSVHTETKGEGGSK